MRETPEDPSRSCRLLWTGTLLLVIGLSLVLVIGEWFAGFDACLADAACPVGVPSDTLVDLLIVQVIGVATATAGGIGLRSALSGIRSRV